jgi:hypothetical protein
MRALVLTDIRLVIGVAGVPGVVTGRAPSDLLLLVMLTRATFGHRDGSVTRRQAATTEEASVIPREVRL